MFDFYCFLMKNFALDIMDPILFVLVLIWANNWALTYTLKKVHSLNLALVPMQFQTAQF